MELSDRCLELVLPHFFDETGNDFLGGHALGLSSEVGDDAVGEDRRRDSLDVFEACHVGSAEGGPGFGSENEVLDGPRAGSPAGPRRYRGPPAEVPIVV